jgi:glycosidase
LSRAQPSVVLQAYPDHVRHPDGESSPLQGLAWFLELPPTGAIDALHPLPPYLSDADFGFSDVDYQAIDPAFGSWEDVHALKRHARIVLDFVVNHVSSQHPWFQSRLAGDPRYAEHFIGIDPTWTLGRWLVRAAVSPRRHTPKPPASQSGSGLPTALLRST